MGVRTPWTIASERVWNDTHRLAAWVFVGAALVGLLLLLLPLSLPATGIAVFALIMTAALTPVVLLLCSTSNLSIEARSDAAFGRAPAVDGARSAWTDPTRRLRLSLKGRAVAARQPWGIEDSNQEKPQRGVAQAAMDLPGLIPRLAFIQLDAVDLWSVLSVRC